MQQSSNKKLMVIYLIYVFTLYCDANKLLLTAVKTALQHFKALLACRVIDTAVGLT